jgi:RNA polymerase sigma-70 factor (sigma-E family)
VGSDVYVERKWAEVTGGDSASFDEYVRTQQVALVRYAALLSGSRAQGEDLVQEVLIRLYPRWEKLADPHPYVRRSITNEFLSWRRRWSTRHVHLVEDDSQWLDIPDAWDSGPDPELWARLQALPGKQRAAVVLRYYEGLADDEIAAVLSCQPSTVRSQISRALSALRIALTAASEVDVDE